MENTEMKFCQSCGMPMESLDLHGTKSDGSMNEEVKHGK